MGTLSLDNANCIGVFLDRDGTISEEVGYINHPSRLQVYPWAPQAVRLLNERGFKVIVATNQAGVARGYFKEELVTVVHDRLISEMAKAGAHLDAIYYCPHHPSVGVPPYRQDCDCRKPKPGMLQRAVEEFGIDLNQSFVVGDRYGDIEFACNGGAHSILVLSGYGLGEYEYQRHNWRMQPEWVAKDLYAAVQIILGIVPQPATMSS